MGVLAVLAFVGLAAATRLPTQVEHDDRSRVQAA
jgi:hypothetical protein